MSDVIVEVIDVRIDISDGMGVLVTSYYCR